MVILKRIALFIKNLFIKLLKYKIIKYPLIIFLFSFIVLFIIIKIEGDSNYNKVLPNKKINDVTKLNPTQVNKIIKPKSISKIIESIKSTTGPISIGGGKYSQGGQTSFENSLHIDMREFKKIINFDKENKLITVQSGITWRDLQDYIDKHGLSVKIMQTYSNFTVGGSISVNCHGRYVGYGPIISSIKELELVLANGDLITCSLNKNSDIFNSVIGGYGGIGVITNVTLELEANTRIERVVEKVFLKDYLNYFNNKIKINKEIIFQNGDLYPPEFNEINSVYWINTDKELTNEEKITPRDNSYFFEPKIVEIVSWGNFGKWFRRNIIDPIIYSFDAVVWRNKEASYDVKELEPSSRENYTYVLQEYFIPVNNIESFTEKMKVIFNKYDVNVINISLRHSLPDTNSFLSWAPEEVFAFVVYYKQGTDSKSKSIVKNWTIEMTEAILSENGKWYLPYQPHATLEQFKKAFKNSDKYFNIKNKLDSNFRFKNKLLDKYNEKYYKKINNFKKSLKGYYRDEQQSFLTVPEWYLVFNPKEYSDFIIHNDPSDFPFYSSMQEYWKLYDRSLKLTSNAYELNSEYKTMLDVIGISTTLEYLLKYLYETTIGAFFSLFETGYLTEEEKVILKAHKAYSDFIYHTAWYEFNFLEYIYKIWSVSDKSNEDFIRKYERTIFFTVEFFIKSIYASLIEYASKSTYDKPIEEIYMHIESDIEISERENLKIVFKEGKEYILSIKRWDKFTKELLELDNKIRIKDISGNDEIVVSIITSKAKIFDLKSLELLYKSEILTNNKLSRFVYKVDVNELLLLIKKCKDSKIEVEHIYDY